jgi:hypothetical protein
MILSKFSVHEIADVKQRDELNAKLADDEFTQSEPRVWIISFDADGVAYNAGLRLGHRKDVADTINQYDIKLRVRDEQFDEDSFIPEATVADILRLVDAELQKRIQFV